MTKEEAKKIGATHYLCCDGDIYYFFYSKDVDRWFEWHNNHKYWSSKVFRPLINELKPL